MSDQDERIKEMKAVAREKKKEDGAFDGRFVERAVPDKRKQKEKRACRGEQEREAIEKSLEEDVASSPSSDEEDDGKNLGYYVIQELEERIDDFEVVLDLYSEYFTQFCSEYDDAEKIVDQIFLEENRDKVEEEPSFNPFADKFDDGND